MIKNEKNYSSLLLMGLDDTANFGICSVENSNLVCMASTLNDNWRFELCQKTLAEKMQKMNLFNLVRMKQFYDKQQEITKKIHKTMLVKKEYMTKYNQKVKSCECEMYKLKEQLNKYYGNYGK